MPTAVPTALDAVTDVGAVGTGKKAVTSGAVTKSKALSPKIFSLFIFFSVTFLCGLRPHRFGIAGSSALAFRCGECNAIGLPSLDVPRLR